VTAETAGGSAEEGTTETTLSRCARGSVRVDRTSGVRLLPIRWGTTVRGLTVRSLAAVRVVVLGLVRVMVAGCGRVSRWWWGCVLSVRGRRLVRARSAVLSLRGISTVLLVLIMTVALLRRIATLRRISLLLRRVSAVLLLALRRISTLWGVATLLAATAVEVVGRHV
jgi:hypothetical protein